MSESGFVYPSPILLTDRQIKRTYDSSLKYDKGIIDYVFNPTDKNFEVKTGTKPTRLLNNENKYRLIQFHIHEPAEFLTTKEQYAMEIHFVFREVIEQQNLLVVAFFFNLDPDCISSPMIRQIIQGQSVTLPTIREYWALSGSLTGPSDPMDHAIEWIVTGKPILQINERDFEFLLAFSKTARAIQPREGRDIIYVTVPSEDCTNKDKSFFGVCNPW